MLILSYCVELLLLEGYTTDKLWLSLKEGKLQSEIRSQEGKKRKRIRISLRLTRVGDLLAVNRAVQEAVAERTLIALIAEGLCFTPNRESNAMGVVFGTMRYVKR